MGWDPWEETKDQYKENIEDPLSGAAAGILGDDIYDALTYGVEDLVGDIKQPFKDAEDAAKQLAADAALMEKASTAESVRVMTEENERAVSTARARAGASGLTGASTEMYVSALEETGREDVEWLKKVGASEYQNRVTEGRLAQAQAEGSMWSFGASVVGIGAGLVGLFG